MRYFCLVRMPQGDYLDGLSSGSIRNIENGNIKSIHSYDDNGIQKWADMPGTRRFNNEKIIFFESDADQAAFQRKIDRNTLAWTIEGYRTEESFIDDQNPEAPAKPIYSTYPSTAALIDWMNDVYIGDPPVQSRPTELTLNMVSGSGLWETIP